MSRHPVGKVAYVSPEESNDWLADPTNGALKVGAVLLEQGNLELHWPSGRRFLQSVWLSLSEAFSLQMSPRGALIQD